MYESFSDDEAEWDEAHRSGRLPHSRAMCDECGRPLTRVADLEGHNGRMASCMVTMCKSGGVCSRSGEKILPGELHWECASCQIQVCAAEGPGVSIERQYDYLDPVSGQLEVKQMGKAVLHKRKKRFRSITAGASPEDTAIAKEVVGNLIRICKEVAKEREEVQDKDWPANYFQTLFKTSSVADPAAVLMRLSAATRAIVSQEPILNAAAAPCKVFGDIHGQFRDMMLFFNAYGMPGSKDGPNFVFNGDFVDRGAHQVEVIGSLMALKVLYPDRVFLNRGNHEDLTMNRKYDFAAACSSSLGPEKGEQFLVAVTDMFNYLPLACLVGERILVVHGGIGDGNWTLNDLRQVRRPLNHEQLQDPNHEYAWNILWSDPIAEDDAGNTFGVHTSARSKVAKKFGWNVTQAFCEANELDLVVRSHQAKTDGFGFDVMHDEGLVRVFSARDYEGHRNHGAVLQITEAEGEDEEEPEDLLVVRAQVIKSLTRAD